jgi:hypothetical protein
LRCKAKTKKGLSCKNRALQGNSFCSVHSDKLDIDGLGDALIGAAIGNAIIPGLGGIIGGAVAGRLGGKVFREKRIVKKRVFVSFDFDNDRRLKDFIIGQSKLPDSPFEVIDHSLKEAAPERNWEAKANTAIKRSDIVIVMVGPKTHIAHGVLKEVQMARNANKHIVQIIGYKNGDYTSVPGAGRLYRWNWENLKSLLN